jgi:hypothetical protein
MLFLPKSFSQQLIKRHHLGILHLCSDISVSHPHQELSPIFQVVKDCIGCVLMMFDCISRGHIAIPTHQNLKRETSRMYTMLLI